MRRSQLLVVLLLAATFAAGVAGGVAADRLWLRPRPAEAGGADGRDRGREAGKEEHDDDDEDETVIERFSSELGLTAPQKARIDTILDHYRESMKELRRDVRPRYDALVDSARRRIEAVLDTAQARKYRRLLERKGEDEVGGDSRGEKDGSSERRGRGGA